MERRQLLMAGATMATGIFSSQVIAQPAQSLPDRFAAALSAHDMKAFADLFAEDYVNHQLSAAAPPPPANGKSQKQGSVDFFAARLAGMPDLQVAVEASVVTGDRVAASFVYTGTHDGMYFGITPTHRRLRFTSCDIFSVKNGLLSEHWGMGDIAGILAQLKG
jgi:predicted ester cyclase